MKRGKFMNHDGIKKFIEEVGINYSDIISLISEKYNFSEDKIKRISRDSLDAVVYYLYSQIRQSKNNQIESANEDFIYGGFFGIESINEDFILLIDLQLYRYISVDKPEIGITANASRVARNLYFSFSIVQLQFLKFS